MSDIKGIMENVSIDNMIAFLLNDSKPINGKIEISETAIQASYKTFIDRLEGLYPSSSKDNNSLFDAITEFAAIHEEIYFKMGMIVGTGLATDLKDEYAELKELGIVK